MKLRPKDFHDTMEAVLRRSRAYLEEEMGANCITSEKAIGNIDTLELPRVTIIVGTGGPVSLLIAFCFDHSLLAHLYEVHTAHLGIEENERELYLRETAAEVANIILGHALGDMVDGGRIISLSPPVVLEKGRRLHRPKNALFATIRMVTGHGVLDVYFIGPSEMFDKNLNVLENGG